MLRRARTLLAVLLFLTPAAALAADRSEQADLDGDGAPETLLVREVECFGPEGTSAPPCDEEGFRSRQATVVSTCADGAERRTDLLSREHDAFVVHEVAEADGNRSTTEVLAIGRSGASARVGEERVVRMVRGTDGCLKPRVLFKHPGKAFTTKRPKRASYSGTGDITLDGKGHLRLEQPWYKRSDGSCCPTYLAIATFSYDARGDRFVKTSERVKRYRRG